MPPTVSGMVVKGSLFNTEPLCVKAMTASALEKVNALPLFGKEATIPSLANPFVNWSWESIRNSNSPSEVSPFRKVASVVPVIRVPLLLKRTVRVASNID